jgi:teichuronic acid biosynthesis glycosyltransferase TuaC
MRVLVVTNMYPTTSVPWYGAFLPEQVRAIRAAGVDVDLLIINPRKTRLDYGLKVPSLIRKLSSTEYDIVHTHHTYSLLSVELARRFARSRVPLVLTNHESEATDAEHSTRTWHPTSHLRHSLGLKRFAASRADFVILVAARLQAVIASNVRYEVIPCGVDLEKFKPLDRHACRRRLGIPPDAKVIFFSNRPADYKRFSLTQATYDLIRQRAPEAMLLTAGKIPHDEMPLYFNAADAVLQTSYCEASPAVVKEALACEVPVVSTDAGDTREIIEGVPHCFICRPDPSDLADRVFDCIGRRARGGREQLFAKGLALDQVAARVIEVYGRVM